jgi:two-component system nitrogen regulation response regulator GlnG
MVFPLFRRSTAPHFVAHISSFDAAVGGVGFTLYSITQRLERLAQRTPEACLHKIQLTSLAPWAIIRPSSSRGAFMAGSSSVFTVLLLTSDAEVQTQFRQVLKEASLTVVRDAAAFQKEAAKHPFDAVVMESRGGQDEGGLFPGHIDPSRTLVITGSRSVLKKTAKTLQLLNQNGHILHQGKLRDASLESYLEMKMDDFVKGMRNGSAKNLHPILISAVERPLITSALQETRGNQIQAAELLGLNRNTLRKKIADLHIPLKRTKTKTRRRA